MKKIIGILALALLSGCVGTENFEKIPDCETEKSEKCVLCVDRAGNGDWYYTGDVNGQKWDGCPSGTRLVRPN